MKLAVVVQRYGADISGGAELHARYIAERLARHAEVEVLTTCARDYISWKNELPEGIETVNGLRVRRFPVTRPRNVEDFGRRSHFVFEQPHSLADELKWLESEGPASRRRSCSTSRARATLSISSSSSAIATTTRGTACGRCPAKAVLVPTAERDAAIGLSIFAPLFRSARAVMFNSFEERALITGGEPARGPGRRRRRRIGRSRSARSRGASARSSTSAAVRDLHRPHRREQGLHGALLVLRAVRGRCTRTASTWCSSGRRCCRSRRTRGSGTSASCPTKTSSTRSRPPTC